MMLHTASPIGRPTFPARLSRREMLAASAAAVACSAAPGWAAAREPQFAQIAITLDLEMSRNFPTWETTHWDYDKGNLDQPTKQYALEAARRVSRRSGLLHAFVVGRVLEQEDVGWLEEIRELGHPLGNHTYDHVNVKAGSIPEAQFRFQRAPWLAGGRSVKELIADNIRLTDVALERRLGVKSAGFRTPGGFNNGLTDRADVQQMLLAQGYRWVSSKYPAHALGSAGEAPSTEVFDSIVQAQAQAQPFTYDSGLIEIPMSPVSDITAFRGGRWQLADFLKAIELALEWAISQRAVFDFLAHPSCLGVVDPEFRTIDLICDRVEAAGAGARLVTLDAVADSMGAADDA